MILHLWIQPGLNLSLDFSIMWVIKFLRKLIWVEFLSLETKKVLTDAMVHIQVLELLVHIKGIKLHPYLSSHSLGYSWSPCLHLWIAVMAPTVLSAILTSPSVHTSWETCSIAHACRYTPRLPSSVPVWDSPILCEAFLSTFCLRNTVVTIHICSWNKGASSTSNTRWYPPVRVRCQPMYRDIWLQNPWSVWLSDCTLHSPHLSISSWLGFSLFPESIPWERKI